MSRDTWQDVALGIIVIFVILTASGLIIACIAAIMDALGGFQCPAS